MWGFTTEVIQWEKESLTYLMLYGTAQRQHREHDIDDLTLH